LVAGDWLRFDLRANPAVTRKTEGGGSRRHDVLMDAKRQAGKSDTRNEAMNAAALQWLVARAPEWGLALREESVLTAGYTQHRLRHGGRQIAFSSLDYHGLAQVTDSERLVRALTLGVGHARGFGCGLLLARRVN
jgi:CRISPR system Cascade subunit CasE